MNQDELNQEYSNLCAQLGAIEANAAIDKPRILKRIIELTELAQTLNQTEAPASEPNQ